MPYRIGVNISEFNFLFLTATSTHEHYMFEERLCKILWRILCCRRTTAERSHGAVALNSIQRTALNSIKKRVRQYRTFIKR